MHFNYSITLCFLLICLTFVQDVYTKKGGIVAAKKITQARFKRSVVRRAPAGLPVPPLPAGAVDTAGITSLAGGIIAGVKLPTFVAPAAGASATTKGSSSNSGKDTAPSSDDDDDDDGDE